MFVALSLCCVLADGKANLSKSLGNLTLNAKELADSSTVPDDLLLWMRCKDKEATVTQSTEKTTVECGSCPDGESKGWWGKSWTYSEGGIEYYNALEIHHCFNGNDEDQCAELSRAGCTHCSFEYVAQVEKSLDISTFTWSVKCAADWYKTLQCADNDADIEEYTSAECKECPEGLSRYEFEASVNYESVMEVSMCFDTNNEEFCTEQCGYRCIRCVPSLTLNVEDDVVVKYDYVPDCLSQVNEAMTPMHCVDNLIVIHEFDDSYECHQCPEGFSMASHTATIYERGEEYDLELIGCWKSTECDGLVDDCEECEVDSVKIGEVSEAKWKCVKSAGLSGGAIAGIVIGCVAVVGGVTGVLVYFLVIRK